MLLIQEVGNSGGVIGIIILDSFRWYDQEGIIIGDIVRSHYSGALLRSLTAQNVRLKQ